MLQHEHELRIVIFCQRILCHSEYFEVKTSDNLLYKKLFIHEKTVKKTVKILRI